MKLIAPIVLLLAPAVAFADPGLELFEKSIRPVLVEQCYSCHSAQAKKSKGGLRLDSKAAVLKGGDSGPSLIAGKPAESLLIKAIRHAPNVTAMPLKGKLPAAVIADFEKWIALGAPDPRTGAVVTANSGIDIEKGKQFWSFRPVQAYGPPAVKDPGWAVSDVDRFLLAKLEEKGLKPAPDADKATLIRRMYFDLIGLPPTVDETDAFVADRSPEALPKVVDRLLASPHFGERWGRHWLDVARFSESSGGGRSMVFPDAWRYRDYVVDAYNRDLPYDRFLIEQIAGDLLPADTPEQKRRQIVATAFLALGPTNYERQDKDILETDVIDEQIDTMGRAFLGLTLGCARCHDHKFDPVPTKDYYALAAIFRSTRTLIHSNVSKWVESPLPVEPGQEPTFRRHDAAVADLKERIKRAKDVEKKAGGTTVIAKAGPTKAVAVKDLPGIVIDDAQAKKVGMWKTSTYTKGFIGEGYAVDERTAQGEKTITFAPDFPNTAVYEVRLAYSAGTNRAKKVEIHILHADGEETVHVDQTKAPPIDGLFITLGKFRFEKMGQNFVLLSTNGADGYVIADAVQFLPEEKADGLRDQGAANAQSADVKKLEAELKKLNDSAPTRPLAMAVDDAGKIGDFWVNVRGNVHNKGENVARGFLKVATYVEPPTIPAKQSGRRELAAWLTAPTNPLTARVMVNRIWLHLFGSALVRTPDNFGIPGERPSHPELLDHLAAHFMKNGWSQKTLIRELMLSRAYRMSSALQAQAVAVDPENRLFWRMNPKRLEAEAIRDAILVVSGKLDRTIGGPTVKKGTATETGYVFEGTRRSLYVPVFRNRLLELFEVFDFADPNLVAGRRNVSTVPTQALFMMNSPFVMEQAKLAAVAAAAEAGDDAARVERAYRRSLGRAPTATEREAVLKFVGAAGGAAEKAAAWERVFQALFACIDFRYAN